ncbi:hypothetical protein [Flavobacterium sp.]
MKKLFFTAIALIAFNGVSMANSITENSSIEVNIKKLQQEGTVSCTRRSTVDCGNGNSVTVSYTASVPSTGDHDVDKGKACAAAAAKSKSLSEAGC